MTIMKKTYFLSVIFALGTAVCIRSQNLNPTVEVVNSFSATIAKFDKPAENMTVPDSLLQFTLNFDYDIFENPYKGAYTFNPYVIDFKPQKKLVPAKKLYFEAGAGYSLRPFGKIVFQPVQKNNLIFSFYAKHYSYFGKYRYLNPYEFSEGKYVLSPSIKNKSLFYEGYMGYDAETTGGMRLDYRFAGGMLYADVAYHGIHASGKLPGKEDSVSKIKVGNASNSISFKGGISNKYAPGKIVYDVDAFIEYGKNNSFLSGIPDQNFSDFYSRVKGNIEFASFGFSTLKIGGDFEKNTLAGTYDADINKISVRPAYMYDNAKIHIDLGIDVTVFHSPDSVKYPVLSGAIKKTNDKIALFPFIDMEYRISKLRSSLYLTAGGKSELFKYNDLLEKNHTFNLHYLHDDLSGPGAGAEIRHFIFGVKGFVKKRLYYDLNFGWEYYKHLPEYGIVRDDAYGYFIRPVLQRVSYNIPVTNLCLKYDWNNLDFRSKIRVNLPAGIPEYSGAFLPHLFECDFGMHYNWRNRLYMGGDLKVASSRSGYFENTVYHIPGYCDLHLQGEYKVNDKIGVRLIADNVLNMTIQQVPLFSRPPFSISAGICVNL